MKHHLATFFVASRLIFSPSSTTFFWWAIIIWVFFFQNQNSSKLSLCSALHAVISTLNRTLLHICIYFPKPKTKNLFMYWYKTVVKEIKSSVMKHTDVIYIFMDPYILQNIILQLGTRTKFYPNLMMKFNILCILCT